jgi:hypothetical protein
MFYIVSVIEHFSPSLSPKWQCKALHSQILDSAEKYVEDKRRGWLPDCELRRKINKNKDFFFNIDTQMKQAMQKNEETESLRKVKFGVPQHSAKRHST